MRPRDICPKPACVGFVVFLLLIWGNELSAQTGTAVAHAEQTVDVVIVGAGTGGISAAIQAARLGARVALIEETDWIGGQMTAAADSTMDEGGTITLSSGIYAEFLARMNGYYLARGKSVGTCYGGDQHHCFEPSVIQKILYEMIRDVNDEHRGCIDVYLRDRVTKVLQADRVVSGVVTHRQRTFHSKIVIDATELGDVLPLTPAAYRIGKFTSASPGKSCIQDITYMADLKKYPNGVPSELQMHHPPPGYDAEFVAGMRRFLRIDGNPDGNNIPVNADIHSRLRALPDSSSSYNYTASAPAHISRTAVNWFNDLPVTTDIFDRSKRKVIYCAAKLKTLDLIYYIQNDLNERSWSIANDEGYDTPFNREENSCPDLPQEFKAIEVQFPPLPYVRESRRLIGVYTLNGGDVRRESPWPSPTLFTGSEPPSAFSDAIAVGDYTVYLHDCNTQADLEPDLDRITDIPKEFRHGPFQVPIEVLIPLEVDGLLVAEKNISQSRIGNAVTRLQPESMSIGQAAGALAAIAVKQGAQPRNVDPQIVQRTLLDFNSTLARQDLNDLPRNVDEWRAAEFALVHGWLPEVPRGFAPAQPLSRAEAAAALAFAFRLLSVKSDVDRRWGYVTASAASFKDVPLYAKDSAAIEALAAVHALQPCDKGSDLFCPDQTESVADFDFSIAALKNRGEKSASGGPTNAIVDSSRISLDARRESGGPLTRINAAKRLYQALEK